MKYSIVIGNSYSQVYPSLSPEIFNKIDLALSYDSDGARFTTMFQNGGWDGKVHLFYKSQKFPTGLLNDVINILRGSQIEYELKYPTLPPTSFQDISDLEKLPYKPWPHQLAAIKQIMGYNRGLIQIATGGGKTYVIALTCRMINTKTLVLTQKLELLYQLREYIEKYTGVKVGIFGDGKYEPGDITVAMIQSLLAAYGDMKKEKIKQDSDDTDDAKSLKLLENKENRDKIFKDLILTPKMVIIDECHHVAARGAYKLIQKMNSAFWRYGFSATTYGYRADNRDCFIRAGIADVIYTATPHDLIKQGLLIPIEIIFVHYNHGRSKGASNYNLFYTDKVSTNPERNLLAIKIAKKMVEKGYQVLIAVQRIAHGDFLLEGLKKVMGEDKVIFLNGSEESDMRNKYLHDFKNGSLPILISTVINEGVDIPSLACIINVRAEEAKISTIQLIGRAMRIHPGKAISYYFDIYDYNIKWLTSHSKKRKQHILEEGFAIQEVPAGNIEEYVEKNVKIRILR